LVIFLIKRWSCSIILFKDAATAFFKQAINNNGLPDKVVMDKSGANYAGLANINLLLILAGFATLIDIFESYVLFQFLQLLLERSETL
jgi:putative transposase